MKDTQINEIEKTLTALKHGKTILYPTDTVWGIGCDATNFNAIEEILKLKQREKGKTMIVLVDSIQMLKRYVYKIPSTAYTIIEHNTKPTTIIYDKPMGISENLVASDNTLAIRIVQNDFCRKLIRKFKKPIVSTSANISGERTPKSFSEISPEILKGVDYVVNLYQNKKSTKPSSIIKLSNNGMVKVIRE
ncbi:MAG: threonylcarbamoyl-AMP synthase [Flavobacteriaceae bacterium]|nr:threonylcarbamoyl-AMP synthase [Flavobacteriaceae bacterium]